MGQVADEADRVGEQQPDVVGELPGLGVGIERREQPLRNQHARAGELVEKRGLARVGVADERNPVQAAPTPALGRPLAVHPLEPFAQGGDPLLDAPSVDFELGLARTAGTDAAAQARKLRARADQPALAVLKQRKLDLEFCLGAAGMNREDVEYQRRAVYHPNPHRFLEVTLLGRRQRFINNEQVGRGFTAECRQPLGEPSPEVERRVHLVPDLDQLLDHLTARGPGQRREFVERVGPHPTVPVRRRQPDQQGAEAGRVTVVPSAGA